MINAPAYEREDRNWRILCEEHAFLFMKSEKQHHDVRLLKSRFVEAGCKVADLDGSNFEIVPAIYPVATHVRPTPSYLQLVTVLYVQGQGFRPNSSSKLLNFLSSTNSRATLAKFTDGTKIYGRRYEGWNVAVTANLIAPRDGLDFDVGALKNLILLWSEDIGNCVNQYEFLVQAMM
jgi:hypothetical protein